MCSGVHISIGLLFAPRCKFLLKILLIITLNCSTCFFYLPVTIESDVWNVNICTMFNEIALWCAKQNVYCFVSRSKY